MGTDAPMACTASFGRTNKTTAAWINCEQHAFPPLCSRNLLPGLRSNQAVPLTAPGGGGEARKHYRGPATLKGSRGPTTLHMFLSSHISIITCRLYKLTPPDHTQVTLQVTVTVPDLVSRSVAGPPLVGARTRSR
jgi:hypothetical protein